MKGIIYNTILLEMTHFMSHIEKNNRNKSVIPHTLWATLKQTKLNTKY